jgi:hypothetical protein
MKTCGRSQNLIKNERKKIGQFTGRTKQSPVEVWWHTVTHGQGSEGETGECSGKPLPFTLPRNMEYLALLPLMRTPRLPVVDWTEAPADLNRVVRFAERRNLVSARVPSHLKRSLHFYAADDVNSPQKRSIQVKLYQAVRIAEKVQTLRERATMSRCTYNDYLVSTLIPSFSSLCYDSSKASSKASSPHSAN